MLCIISSIFIFLFAILFFGWIFYDIDKVNESRHLSIQKRYKEHEDYWLNRNKK